MKKIPLLILLSVFTIIVPVASGLSCNSENRPDKNGSENITPLEVLSSLPVFPDSTPVIGGEPGFEPFSTPLSPQVEGRPPNVEYETVSAWYEVRADTDKILDWYTNKLGGKGYRKYTEMVYVGKSGDFIRGGSYEIRSVGFYRPELPEISVEIHVSSLSETQIFVILVNHEITGAFNPSVPYEYNGPPDRL